jgi:hypothetical protein
MKLAALVVLGACGKSAPPQPLPEAAPLIGALQDFADRCDACKSDMECVRPVRDDFDGVKGTLIPNGKRLVGDDKAAWDRELLRLRACGDGAGLTFWLGD